MDDEKTPGASRNRPLSCSGGLLRQLDLAISLGIEVRLVAYARARPYCASTISAPAVGGRQPKL
jgi:hypothetical protein